MPGDDCQGEDKDGVLKESLHVDSIRREPPPDAKRRYANQPGMLPPVFHFNFHKSFRRVILEIFAGNIFMVDEGRKISTPQNNRVSKHLSRFMADTLPVTSMGDGPTIHAICSPPAPGSARGAFCRSHADTSRLCSM